jgi:hypothetical protein
MDDIPASPFSAEYVTLPNDDEEDSTLIESSESEKPLATIEPDVKKYGVTKPYRVTIRGRIIK